MKKLLLVALTLVSVGSASAIIEMPDWVKNAGTYVSDKATAAKTASYGRVGLNAETGVVAGVSALGGFLAIYGLYFATRKVNVDEATVEETMQSFFDWLCENYGKAFAVGLVGALVTAGGTYTEINYCDDFNHNVAERISGLFKKPAAPSVQEQEQVQVQEQEQEQV
ncbi:MAG: hypothetical protein WCT20_00395 [Candidatus Babeliales bacterium]|jgi:hypothetical protein